MQVSPTSTGVFVAGRADAQQALMADAQFLAPLHHPLRDVVARAEVLEGQPERREGAIRGVEAGVGVDQDRGHPDLRLGAGLVADALLAERLRLIVGRRLGRVAVVEAGVPLKQIFAEANLAYLQCQTSST